MPATSQSDPRPIVVDSAAGTVLAGEDVGEGAPIVLLHGLTATRRYVVHGSKHLISRNRRLISYDARGHGESDPAPAPADYRYTDLAADLRAVLDALQLDRVALAGSSMGAATAVRFALDHPERVTALIQITPAHTGIASRGGRELDHWDRLADAMAAGDLDAFVAEAVGERVAPRWRMAAATATRQRIERHRHPRAVADALRAVPRSDAFDGLRALESLDLPVLVVGSRDEVDPGHPLAVARTYAEHIPDARLLVEDEGSSPLAWQGSRLSRAIGDFLDESEP